MAIRILLVDDHGVLRAGLRALLNSESDLVVVGEATDGAQVAQLTELLSPDVVLMDVSMAGKDGIETTRELRKVHPDVRVLLLTIHDDEWLVREAIRVGAAGYIVKNAVESELINAIRAVSAGHMYIHPSLTRALISEETRSTSTNLHVETLTMREVQVLMLVARGHTNKQIAELLNLSTRTVESHRANMMAKLDLHSRVELVRYASEHGLLNTHSDGIHAK